jgi:spermidine synthase
LCNEVLWQRALKVFLGGSETVSSMTVLLVFLGGLGAGSIWMGRRASRFQDPLRTLALIELLLFAVNLVICSILRSDLSESVFAVQSLALSLGVPLHLIYALSAALILIVPCLLMGATMPLAAEVCQRRFGLGNSRLLGLLFFINTFGAVAGTALASGYLISHLGQTASLWVAAGLNLAAATLLGVLVLAIGRNSLWHQTAVEQPEHISTPRRLRRPALEDILALGLGFCSLGYEMYLFRLIALRHQPLPFTFASVLTGFLLFWSLGAALSTRVRLSLSGGFRLCAFFLCLSIPMYAIDSSRPVTGAWDIASFALVRFPYFVPCLFFGYLFSSVAARAARSWGRDVGRIYAWNTAGCCLGIVGMTFIGYEMPFFMMVLLIAFLLYAMQEMVSDVGHASPPRLKRARYPRWIYPLCGAIATVVVSLGVDLSGATPGMRMYYGRDGVIGVDDEGNMIWDGLWHSALSRNSNHVGTNNWYLAVCPVLSHGPGMIEDVCVIGVATGITASTLAKLDTVRRVDGYDITHTLEEIYERYPEGTLHLTDNDKIRIIWQDARSGLSLSPHTKYDIIQTQPLYLKQAGSSLLNSVEFYTLVSRRLKPNGVFCLYSNGTPEQAFVIRQTAARVFRHRASFMDGYLLILSNDPIDLSGAAVAERLRQPDPLWEEIRGWAATRDAGAVLRLADIPPISWGDGRLVVTDNHPIVEYPNYLAEQVDALGYAGELPTPYANRTYD